jgi:hypothetical protein
MDAYSIAYGEIADQVWDTEFVDHPVKQKKTIHRR